MSKQEISHKGKKITAEDFHAVSPLKPQRISNLDSRKKGLVYQIKSETDRLLHKLPHQFLGLDPNLTMKSLNDKHSVNLAGHTISSLQELLDVIRHKNQILEDAMRSGEKQPHPLDEIVNTNNLEDELETDEETDEEDEETDE
jgi:hypothetical protein